MTAAPSSSTNPTRLLILDRPKRGRWGAEDPVRDVEVFVHPDQQGNEDEAECFEEERFVDRTGTASGMFRSRWTIGRTAAPFRYL